MYHHKPFALFLWEYTVKRGRLNEQTVPSPETDISPSFLALDKPTATLVNIWITMPTSAPPVMQKNAFWTERHQCQQETIYPIHTCEKTEGDLELKKESVTKPLNHSIDNYVPWKSLRTQNQLAQATLDSHHSCFPIQFVKPGHCMIIFALTAQPFISGTSRPAGC